MKARPGVMLYFDLRKSVKRLSLEQKGRLLDALLAYGQDGEVPAFNDPMLDVCWDFVQPRIDQDAQRYLEISEKRRESVTRRWEKKPPSEANNTNVSFVSSSIHPDTSDTNTTQIQLNSSQIQPNSNTNTILVGNSGVSAPAKRKRFSPPTQEEAQAYFVEQKSTREEANRFQDFYSSKGWRVGNSPMRDWKAAARNWIRRDDTRGKPSAKPPTRNAADYDVTLLFGGGTNEDVS